MWCEEVMFTQQSSSFALLCSLFKLNIQYRETSQEDEGDAPYLSEWAVCVEILQDVDYSWLFSWLIILGYDSFVNMLSPHVFLKDKATPSLQKNTLYLKTCAIRKWHLHPACMNGLAVIIEKWKHWFIPRHCCWGWQHVCVIEKCPLGATGRSPSGEMQNRLKVGSVQVTWLKGNRSR